MEKKEMKKTEEYPGAVERLSGDDGAAAGDISDIRRKRNRDGSPAF
jgi:hypothetical protein